MNRIDPTPAQKRRLLQASASRCCVCKCLGIGFNFHHIDGDPSNTVDSNLAVLCVEDHDIHHRPGEYTARLEHLELCASEILRLKHSWEAFVKEARQANPRVVATLSRYGTQELVHSLQLVMQWPDERIECARSFHLLDGDIDRLEERAIKEVTSISPRIKIARIEEPFRVEYCPCCGVGFSRTIKPAVVIRLTDSSWSTESVCTVYVNPSQPSLALTIFLRERLLLSGSLHLCQGKYLHYHSEGVNDRVPLTRSSIREQATQVVRHILSEWTPARTLIGTGNPDAPRITSNLMLPRVWENRTANKSADGTARKLVAPHRLRWPRASGG